MVAKRKAVKRKARKKTAKRRTKKPIKKKAVRKSRARPGKKPGKGAGAGRPRLRIDPDLVKQMAGILCTMEEMASVLGCSVDTLERNFADAIKKGRDQGRAALRRLQWQGAQSGNPTMLIWLGKQLLAQTDKMIQEHTGAIGIKRIERVIVDPQGPKKKAKRKKGSRKRR